MTCEKPQNIIFLMSQNGRGSKTVNVIVTALKSASVEFFRTFALYGTIEDVLPSRECAKWVHKKQKLFSPFKFLSLHKMFLQWPQGKCSGHSCWRESVEITAEAGTPCVLRRDSPHVVRHLDVEIFPGGFEDFTRFEFRTPRTLLKVKLISFGESRAPPPPTPPAREQSIHEFPDEGP